MIGSFFSFLADVTGLSLSVVMTDIDRRVSLATVLSRLGHCPDVHADSTDWTYDDLRETYCGPTEDSVDLRTLSIVFLHIYPTAVAPEWRGRLVAFTRALFMSDKAFETEWAKLICDAFGEEAIVSMPDPIGGA